MALLTKRFTKPHTHPPLPAPRPRESPQRPGKHPQMRSPVQKAMHLAKFPAALARPKAKAAHNSFNSRHRSLPGKEPRETSGTVDQIQKTRQGIGLKWPP